MPEQEEQRCSAPGCPNKADYGYLVDKEGQVHPICSNDWRQYHGSPYFPQGGRWPASMEVA